MYCQYCHALLAPNSDELHAGFCSAEHRDLHADVLKRRDALTLEPQQALQPGQDLELDFPDGCPICGASIPLLAKLRGARFCSSEHEAEHKRRAEKQIMERLNWHAQGGAGSGAMQSGRKPRLRRPTAADETDTPVPPTPLPARTVEWTDRTVFSPGLPQAETPQSGSEIGFTRFDGIVAQSPESLRPEAAEEVLTAPLSLWRSVPQATVPPPPPVLMELSVPQPNYESRQRFVPLPARESPLPGEWIQPSQLCLSPSQVLECCVEPVAPSGRTSWLYTRPRWQDSPALTNPVSAPQSSWLLPLPETLDLTPFPSPQGRFAAIPLQPDSGWLSVLPERIDALDLATCGSATSVAVLAGSRIPVQGRFTAVSRWQTVRLRQFTCLTANLCAQPSTLAPNGLLPGASNWSQLDCADTTIKLVPPPVINRLIPPRASSVELPAAPAIVPFSLRPAQSWTAHVPSLGLDVSVTAVSAGTQTAPPPRYEFGINRVRSIPWGTIRIGLSLFDSNWTGGACVDTTRMPVPPPAIGPLAFPPAVRSASVRVLAGLAALPHSGPPAQLWTSRLPAIDVPSSAAAGTVRPAGAWLPRFELGLHCADPLSWHPIQTGVGSRLSHWRGDSEPNAATAGWPPPVPCAAPLAAPNRRSVIHRGAWRPLTPFADRPPREWLAHVAVQPVNISVQAWSVTRMAARPTRHNAGIVDAFTRLSCSAWHAPLRMDLSWHGKSGSRDELANRHRRVLNLPPLQPPCHRSISSTNHAQLTAICQPDAARCSVEWLSESPAQPKAGAAPQLPSLAFLVTGRFSVTVPAPQPERLPSTSSLARIFLTPSMEAMEVAVLSMAPAACPAFIRAASRVHSLHLTGPLANEARSADVAWCQGFERSAMRMPRQEPPSSFPTTLPPRRQASHGSMRPSLLNRQTRNRASYVPARIDLRPPDLTKTTPHRGKLRRDASARHWPIPPQLTTPSAIRYPAFLMASGSVQSEVALLRPAPRPEVPAAGMARRTSAQLRLTSVSKTWQRRFGFPVRFRTPFTTTPIVVRHLHLDGSIVERIEKNA